MSNIIINKNAVIILNPFIKLSHSQIYVQDLKKKLKLFNAISKYFRIKTLV